MNARTLAASALAAILVMGLGTIRIVGCARGGIGPLIHMVRAWRFFRTRRRRHILDCRCFVRHGMRMGELTEDELAHQQEDQSAAMEQMSTHVCRVASPHLAAQPLIAAAV